MERITNTLTASTLRPCREDSVDFDDTQNLYIEGDNLGYQIANEFEKNVDSNGRFHTDWLNMVYP